MKKNLHPRRTLRQMHRVLCLTLMVLSLTTMLIPFAAAADLDGGLSSRGTIGNITDTTSAADPDTGLSGGTGGRNTGQERFSAYSAETMTEVERLRTR